MTILQQAKEVQQQCSDLTKVWVKLSLLEGLIAEIEMLQHKVDVLSQEHPATKLRAVGHNVGHIETS